MKRWGMVILLVVLVAVLVQTPAYWQPFGRDDRKYKTDTFYHIIKEEYEENEQGQRLYRREFTDIQDGDILVTDSTYCLCFRHGHAALVVEAEMGITLEAFGVGTRSEYSSLQEWRRYPHVLVLRLKASQTVRKKVAAYAEKKLVGIPYRLCTGMIGDKDMKGEYWGTQCAHLVWAAYAACGYDIDGTGGWLVTPSDFLSSALLQVVPQE